MGKMEITKIGTSFVLPELTLYYYFKQILPCNVRDLRDTAKELRTREASRGCELNRLSQTGKSG